MNKMWSMTLKICRSRDLTLREIHLRRRYKSTTLRTCFLSHGVHLVFLDRQETSIINDEVNARTVLSEVGVEETVAIWVATGRRTSKTFAHTAPENGVTREFGAYARIEDCEKRGYKEMILRRNGEFALNAVQDEVKGLLMVKVVCCVLLLGATLPRAVFRSSFE